MISLSSRKRQGLAGQTGFSLIEILLSIGVFSALAFAGIGWMHLLNKEAGSTNENAAIANAMTQIRYAFGDDDRYCRNILAIQHPSNQPRPFNVNLPAGQSIPSIDYYDLATSAHISNVVTMGQKVGTKDGLMMKEITLRPVANLSPATVLASLDFRFVKSAATNGMEIVRHMPIYVTMDNNGTIKSCSTSLSTILITARACEVNSNGFQRYNPLTGQCELIDGVYWHSNNDVSFAQCPAPDLVAVSGMEPNPSQVACRTVSTDGPTMPPRSYQSGHQETSNAMGWDARLDAATSKCTFTYVSGALPTSGSVAQIKCYKTGVVQR